MLIHRRSVYACALAWCLAVLAGCAATVLSTTWRDPSTKTISFKKVVVLVLNSSPGERRVQEDALVAQIKHAHAVPSYTFISDDELADTARAKSKIAAAGFDGAAILRLVDRVQEVTYVPGSTSVWNDSWGYTSYQYHPPHATTDTIIRAEVSLHSVPDGKLIWAGGSETMNPKDARAFATEVAQAAAAELRKQKLLN